MGVCRAICVSGKLNDDARVYGGAYLLCERAALLSNDVLDMDGIASLECSELDSAVVLSTMLSIE